MYWSPVLHVCWSIVFSVTVGNVAEVLTVFDAVCVCRLPLEVWDAVIQSIADAVSSKQPGRSNFGNCL